jgi:capsid portal protein
MENKNIMKVLNFNCDCREEYSERRINGSWTTWGQDNLRGEYLLGLLNKSSKHNAIIKSKSAMVGGNGWNKENLSTNALLFINNLENENTLDEILARVSYDLEVFGGFYLNIIWSKDRTRVAEINYLDYNLVRIQEKTGDEETDSYWYTPDWSKHSRQKPIKYQGFSTDNRREANQILYVKEFRPGQQVYGIPEYISAEGWIALEGAIEEFHNSSVQNGFHPSMVINFPSGIPGSEEMDNIIRRLRAEYEGASKGGKVIFTFSDGSANTPVITPINLNDSDKRFIELNREVTEGILAGHRVINPTLFGIKTSGELGGTNDILESMAIFKAQYVVPKQVLIERVFNKLARINGLTDKLIINEFRIKLDIQPIVSDLLNILAAPISDDQKINILLSIGYTEDKAESIVINNNPIPAPVADQGQINNK